MQRFGGNFINGFQYLGFLHGFRRLTLHCSSNSTNLLESNLVSSSGLSHLQAFSTFSKLSNENLELNDLSTSLDATSLDVVCFFKDCGFNETLIRKIVSSNPNLLCSKVDKTLKPKFDFFKDEGFSRDDVIHIISANPYFLTMSLDSTIAPAIRILRENLICNSNVISVLVRLGLWRKTGGRIINHVLLNVDLLSSYGISMEVIRKHLLLKPSTFCREPETFRDIVTKVDKKLGISLVSPAFMYGIHLACSSRSEEDIELKFQMFRSFGWTQSDIDTLMMKHSICFTLSFENIKNKVGFLMNELGLKPAFLANNSFMLILSLEKRLVPRHDVLQILKENRLLEKSPNFCTVFNMAESRFLKMYVLPFKEVHQVYAEHIGCTVELLLKPSTFCREPKTFRDIVTKLDKKLGISLVSPAMYGIHLACSSRKETIELRFQMFKSFGFTQSDIDKLTMKKASCFTSSAETIKKKLGFLINELGLKPAYLANDYVLLTLSLEKRLVPRHDVLQILKENRLLKKSPNFCSVVKMAESRFLKMYVLPFKEVHQVYAEHIGCTVELLLKPSTFCREPETFRDIVTKVDKKLGISLVSPAFHLACSSRKENIELRFQMFKSFGWTQSDIDTLTMKKASCFKSSSAETIKKKLGLLINELGLKPAFLANNSFMLTLSLEKRLVPRHDVLQILKENRLLKKSPNFCSVVKMAESHFLKMYVLPFKEVHQVYAKHIGCTVESLTQERADDLE